MLRRNGLLSWVLVAALCPQLAAAQVNYKSTLPDGRVVYGDKPAPGAVRVEEVKGAPSKGVSVVTPKEAATLKQREAAGVDREAGNARLRAAEQALKKAEAAQAAGKEPGEGDRIGTVSGAQRFSDAYWARQKRLAEEYEAARANYERALREANNPASGTVNPSGGTPGSASGKPPRGQ